MTRDNIIGLVIIAFIIIGYSIWMAPDEEERREAIRQQQERDSIAMVQRAQAEAMERQQAEAREQAEERPAVVRDDMDTDSLELQRMRDRLGYFSNAATGREGFLVLENQVLSLTLNKKGGHVHSARLKDFRRHDQEDLYLFTGQEDRFTFNFFSGNRNISTENLHFIPYLNGRPLDESREVVRAGEQGLQLSMRVYSDFHSEASPSYIEFVYGMDADEHMLDFDVRFIGTRDAIAPNTTFLNLDWQSRLTRNEKNRQNELNNTTIYYKFARDEVSRIRPTRDGSERLATSVRWISFKQQFFSSVLIAREGFANADITSTSLPEEEEDFLKDMTASISLEYDARTDNIYPLQWYFGPNNYRLLTRYDLELERQIPLGWGFFLTSWINRFVVIPVFNFLDGFEMNYGIIILILTVMLKIVLLPIAFKTYLSQAKMRLLKPEIEELSKKFPKKEDAMKKQQATMALYKKAGVNPMSGCIPMLLQLPILIALFRFFPASIELRQEGFLWADDLSSYDSILDLPFTIPFYGDHVSLFTLLMAASMIVYTHMNSQMMSSSSQMPGMKTMMYFMPVMLLGIFNSFASGLSYYYFLANVITFGQMFLFRRFIDEDALHAKIEENKKKPVKKSKWQQRMEELARQQQAAQKKKARKR